MHSVPRDPWNLPWRKAMDSARLTSKDGGLSQGTGGLMSQADFCWADGGGDGGSLVSQVADRKTHLENDGKMGLNGILWYFHGM